MAKKLPKYNSLRLFNKVAKEVRAELKSQGTDLTWNEAQKYTSKNVFSDFKGLDARKVTPTQIKSKLSLKKDKVKKQKEDNSCFNISSIPVESLIIDEWYEINDFLRVLDQNTQIRINCGSEFGTSQIVKLSEIDVDSFTRQYIDQIRIYAKNKSGVASWQGHPTKREETTGGTCDYFLDFILYIREVPVVPPPVDKIEIQPTDDDRKKMAQRLLELQKERKKTKLEKEREVKKMPRPTELEKKKKSKKKEKPKKKKKKVKKEKDTTRNVVFDLNKELEALREDFKLGIFSKEEYKKERQKIIDLFEKGGMI